MLLESFCSMLCHVMMLYSSTEAARTTRRSSLLRQKPEESNTVPSAAWPLRHDTTNSQLAILLATCRGSWITAGALAVCRSRRFRSTMSQAVYTARHRRPHSGQSGCICIHPRLCSGIPDPTHGPAPYERCLSGPLNHEPPSFTCVAHT